MSGERMGLTKEYLRYIPAGNFNIIASPNCNLKFVTLEGQEGRFVAVGACEHIIIWDLRLAEKAQVLPGEKAVVTAICTSPNKRHLAAGYSDGNVQLYDLKSAEVISIFSGHRTPVTALAFDSHGHQLASGSQDNDVIVWDTVAETGLCRLSGHTKPVTQLAFMSQFPILISGSKDTTVKFWDLELQRCFLTVAEHRNEIWSLTLMKEDKYLVTGCRDAELRVYKLAKRDFDQEYKDPVGHLARHLELINTSATDDDPMGPLQCHRVGSLLRTGHGRVVSMCSDASGQVIGCTGEDKQLELFYFCTNSEAEVRQKKRLKKERKKQKKEAMETDDQPEAEPSTDSVELSLADEVKRLPVIKLANRPKSFDLVLGNGGELRVATNLSNNKVELYTVKATAASKDSVLECLRSVDSQGHRSEVRAACFSSDNLVVVSGSGEAVKIWNRSSQVCMRTVQTGYVYSLLFVPGDRYVLAGLKDGTLVIIDIAAGDIVEEVPAHTTELWSICLFPDQRGCVTGGGDNTVKFWQFELVADEKREGKAKVLSLLHARTLKLEEQVLCVRLSPNGQFVAVALLDSTVKTFFVDTFKLHLNLYGHKSPVLCMDISSDSTLLATGSADRTVKIWGTDYGNVHKSLFAHDDTVTGLQFVPRSHHMFSCGKDGRIKQWDADNYNKIITLQGHAGAANALSVSPDGRFVVSCGSDRVIRLYEKTDQPLVLQDEQEEEREQQDAEAAGEGAVVPGRSNLNLPTRKTVGSVMASESILECLEVSAKYREELAEHEALQSASSQALPLPQPPLLMQALRVSTPDDFLLETIRRIRSTDMEQALLLLPFSSVCEVLQVLARLIARGDETELTTHVAMFLLKLHHKTIMNNHSTLPILMQLDKWGSVKAKELKDMIGFNLYAMKMMQREMEKAEGVQLFRDLTLERKKGQKKKRQRESLKRAHVVLTS